MREQEADRSPATETEQETGLDSRGQRTSVKRNRPPSYNKGYRNEIVKVLLTCGTFSYKSLELYGEKKEMCRRKLKKMEEENMLEEFNVEHKKIVRFRKFEANQFKITKELWPGYYGHYNNYGIANAEAIARTASRLSQAEKARRESEIVVMMIKAGVKTTPEDKARINSEKCIGENETCFYSSLEIKDTGMFKLRMDKTNGQERGTINSRVIGSLIGCGGVYAVYHTGKRPIKWAKSVEGQMAYAISVIARDQYNGNVPAGSIKECIVIGYTNEVFYKIATSENNAVLGLNNGYKSLYAIPYDKNGLTIIQQMIKPEWREKMKKRVLPDHDHVTNNLGIEADGIRGAEIAFLFCIPDLSRLCRFLAALAFSAGQITGEMHYVIYCFDFQKELVEQLNDGLAEIRTVGLEKAILPS